MCQIIIDQKTHLSMRTSMKIYLNLGKYLGKYTSNIPQENIPQHAVIYHMLKIYTCILFYFAADFHA